MLTYVVNCALPILIVCGAFILGIVTGRLSKRCKMVGRFVMNIDDPKKPAFWLELDYDLDVLERQGVLGLKVDRHYETQ